MKSLFLLSCSLLLLPIGFAEVHAIVPRSSPAPVGPYSPGIDAGDYIYIAGQGAEAPDGKMPTTFDEQMRQALENVKAVVETAGLTMEHVVYTQVYLEDMRNLDRMNRIYTQYFLKTPPARAALGVARLAGTPVEINAVAVRDLAGRKPISVTGYDPREPVSPGILTHDRLFVSAMRGRDLRTGTIPADPAAQVALALDGVKAVVEAAGLQMSHMVFVNPYLTTQIPERVMNKLYASRFEFGNTPARATIEVSSLPEGALRGRHRGCLVPSGRALVQAWDRTGRPLYSEYWCGGISTAGRSSLWVHQLSNLSGRQPIRPSPAWHQAR
jgi:reactive intermediate/imine deaminase